MGLELNRKRRHVSCIPNIPTWHIHTYIHTQKLRISCFGCSANLFQMHLNLLEMWNIPEEPQSGCLWSVLNWPGLGVSILKAMRHSGRMVSLLTAWWGNTNWLPHCLVIAISLCFFSALQLSDQISLWPFVTESYLGNVRQEHEK